MRIGFLTGGVFWGLFLILIGILYTLRSIFNWNIPIFRIVFALFIIYLGVSMLIGGSSPTHPKRPDLQDHTPIIKSSSEEYTILFGQGTLDLAALAGEGRAVPKSMQTLFASGTLRVDPKIPIKVRVNAAFAWAQMPDGNGIAFGQYIYKTPSFDPEQEFIDIEANVVFGELKIVETE